MAFDETLKDLVDGVSGAVGATLMGMDGFSVHHFVKDGGSFDVDSTGIEYGKVIDDIRHASTLLNLGELEEVTVTSGNALLILRVVTKDYYIAYVLKSNANVGKARFYIKKAAVKASLELAL